LLLQLLLLSDVDSGDWLVDIDECSRPEAESCLLNNGVCDGLHPPGSFSCQCGVGYQLAKNSINKCVGKQQLRCVALRCVALRCVVSCCYCSL